MPKIVVSSTLRDPRWANTTVVGDASSLPEVDGDLLLVGSATLLHELLDRDLVDELRLMTFPVSIGGGLRVFGDARHRTAWRRVETTSLPNDVRLDRYERTAMSSGPS